MTSSRLFIDLPLDPFLAKEIYQKFQNLNLPWDKIRKVPPQQMHVTLKFLGDTPMENIPRLITTLSDQILKVGDIALTIYKTLIFNPTSPRVLGIAFKPNPVLNKLYDSLEQILFDQGLAHKELRGFSPHLTLGRIKNSATLKDLAQFNNWQPTGTTSASYFELQESVLTKNGPEYTILQTFDL